MSLWKKSDFLLDSTPQKSRGTHERDPLRYATNARSRRCQEYTKNFGQRQTKSEYVKDGLTYEYAKKGRILLSPEGNSPLR